MVKQLDNSENQTTANDEIKKKKILAEIKAEISRIRNYTPKIGVFGDTGVGKSSLCNALFGRALSRMNRNVAFVQH